MSKATAKKKAFLGPTGGGGRGVWRSFARRRRLWNLIWRQKAHTLSPPLSFALSQERKREREREEEKKERGRGRKREKKRERERGERG